MSSKKIININLNNTAVLDMLSKNGFSYNEIVKIINDPTNSWGFYGSSIFEHISTLFNNDSSSWFSKPNDIDLCVTNKNTFTNLIKYFKKTNKYVVNELPNINDYSYFSMGNVLNVCEIFLKNCSKNTIPLQIINVSAKNIIEHLRKVDFGITKVAFNTNGYILVDEAFEQLSAKKTIFPNKFENVYCLIKTMKRYFKYSNRNVSFEFPDKIELTTKCDNGHATRYIIMYFADKYYFKTCNSLYKIKQYEPPSQIDTLKKSNEKLQNELDKKIEQFERLKRQIKGFFI